MLMRCSLVSCQSMKRKCQLCLDKFVGETFSKKEEFVFCFVDLEKAFHGRPRDDA